MSFVVKAAFGTTVREVAFPCAIDLVRFLVRNSRRVTSVHWVRWLPDVEVLP